jgi:hypothetical protein
MFAGEHAKAVERLEWALDRHSSAERPNAASIAIDRLLLAMARFHLGEKEKARALLAQAIEWFEGYEKPLAADWQRLRAEAEALIQGEGR